MGRVEPDAERKVKNVKTEKKGNEEKQSRHRSIGSIGGWEEKKSPLLASGTIAAPDVREPWDRHLSTTDMY